MLDEVIISRAIVESFMNDFLDYLDVDVAIAGAGPSGLVCAYYLAKANLKVVVFEQQLRLGGGMPGGGMMFNSIVVQDQARDILEEFNVRIKQHKNIYVANALETTAAFAFRAIQAGAKIFNLISVEDVMVRNDNVSGLVLNWSPVNWSKLHVDPLAVKAKKVIDATGHDCQVCRIVEKKLGNNLATPTGKVIGEKSMWAHEGERVIVDNAKEVYPGLYVCGMAANAVFGSHRMGAVFGGMLLSGKKVAQELIEILNENRKETTIKSN